MAILATETARSCKLCRHARRPEIDALIEQRSNRTIKPDDFFAALTEMGVENPTVDNVKNHLKKHCRIVDENVAEREAEVESALKDLALTMFTEILGGDWREHDVSPEVLIELQRRLYVHELELRIAAGLPTGITHDHVLKGIAEQTKRKQEDAVNELLRGVGRGVETALSSMAARPALPAPAHADIEGEVVGES